MGLGTFHCGRLTRTQPPVYLQKRLFHILGGILLDGGQDALILAEKVQNFLIAAQTQSPDKGGDRDLSILVDSDIEDIVGVSLIF